MSARCLIATCQTWSSTTVLPRLLVEAGATVTSLSPGPLGLSRDLSERLRLAREPDVAAAQLLSLLGRRRFDWVFVADELLLRALVERRDSSAPADWLAVDPSDSRAVEFLLSKHAFVERANSLGIPVPASRFASSSAEAALRANEVGYPVVVKGDRGFGGLEVRIARDETELTRISRGFLARYPRVLLQRFIAGTRVSACALYDKGQLNAYKIYRAECTYPDAHSASTVHEFFSHASIEETLRKLGGATRFHGMAGVDFMHESETGALFAIEVNPRPTIGFGGSVANRRFFAPAIAGLLRHERVLQPAVYDGREPIQSYFPSHLFYLATTGEQRDPKSLARLSACLREGRLRDWRLVLWETARFCYDAVVARVPSVRAFSAPVYGDSRSRRQPSPLRR